MAIQLPIFDAHKKWICEIICYRIILIFFADDLDEVDEDEEISFKVPTKKDEPEVPENGSADNSKEKLTNQDDLEVPEDPGSPNLKQIKHNVLNLFEKEADEEPQLVQLGRYYKVVNIYFSPSKLYGSSKARFLAKNQL